MAESYIQISGINGIDNISDPSRVSDIRAGRIYVTEADNVDIDNDRMLHRRIGRNLILGGSGMHSLWSDGRICLFVQGNAFKKLNTDNTPTTLVTDVNPTDRMSYVSVVDSVFFSNYSIIGYVNMMNGLPYPFPDPDQTFKQRMIGGHILEFFNNRLYAANDRIIYHSDATVLTRMDIRKNAIPFPDRITMMRAVTNGMYVSSGKGVYFMSGMDPSEFKMHKVLDVGAIDGMSITVDGDSVDKFGSTGRTIYFMTEDGPYKGYPGGSLLQMQGGLFSIEDIECGTSLLIEDGYQQFLSIGQLRAGIGGISGKYITPRPIMTGLG